MVMSGQVRKEVRMAVSGARIGACIRRTERWCDCKHLMLRLQSGDAVSLSCFPDVTIHFFIVSPLVVRDVVML